LAGLIFKFGGNNSYCPQKILIEVNMKKILIGCPYTSMKNIVTAINEIDNEKVIIIQSEDVKALFSDRIYVGNKLQEHKINSFKASFLRYPYDLIPPHSQSFELREKMEFYKSLALAVDKKSINSIGSTWMLRNRYYSLNQASLAGVAISPFAVINNPNALNILNKKQYAVKAIGNCYVTEDLESLEDRKKLFMKIEEESNGEKAAIFPASLLEKKEIERYLSAIGSAFLQSPLENHPEYRCYIIGEQRFLYKREKWNQFDKSPAKYCKTDYQLSTLTYIGLRKMMNKFRLNYLCFDIILENNNEILIDINPYGSMPKYDMFPEPSIKLAELLIQ
jgi:hypothetical protein